MNSRGCFSKRRFDTEQKAKKAINKIIYEEEQRGNTVYFRTYPCIEGRHPCGGWHITKSPERELNRI